MSQIKINQTVSSELRSIQSNFFNLQPSRITKHNMVETNLKKAEKCIDEHQQISKVIWSLKLAGLADIKDAMNQIKDAGDIDEELAKAIKAKGTMHVHITNRQKEAKTLKQVERMKKNRT